MGCPRARRPAGRVGRALPARAACVGSGGREPVGRRPARRRLGRPHPGGAPACRDPVGLREPARRHRAPRGHRQAHRAARRHAASATSRAARGSPTAARASRRRARRAAMRVAPISSAATSRRCTTTSPASPPIGGRPRRNRGSPHGRPPPRPHQHAAGSHRTRTGSAPRRLSPAPAPAPAAAPPTTGAAPPARSRAPAARTGLPQPDRAARVRRHRVGGRCHRLPPTRPDRQRLPHRRHAARPRRGRRGVRRLAERPGRPHRGLLGPRTPGTPRSDHSRGKACDFMVTTARHVRARAPSATTAGSSPMAAHQRRPRCR